MTTLGRREFLAGAGALAASIRLKAESPFGSAMPTYLQRLAPLFPPSVRADFPSVLRETYMNSAALHPVGTFAADAVKQLVDFRLLGPGEGRADFGAAKQDELKKKFGAMINASASEIAYTANTSDGENIVVMGLDLSVKSKGSNIVIDELHFTTSLYMYKELEKKGVELRIVKHKNWAIDPEDMAKAIDKNTRLVSMALVSNVNGFMHDAKAVSAIAHARGALVFADIIQAVGAVPVDVKALGIDFASSGTYKWLMGERGIGFLYVREDLQGTVLPTTRYGHRQVSNFNRAALSWEPHAGRGALRDRRHPGDDGGVRERRHRLRQQVRTDQHPRAREAADRSPAEGTAAARLQGADADGDADADRRVRAEGRRGDDEDAAGRQGSGDGGGQREPHPPRRVGVQQSRRHRSDGRRAGWTSRFDVTPMTQIPGPQITQITQI